MSLIIELSLEDYAFEVESQEGFVLVSFYGNNCAPCREIREVIENLSIEYKDHIKFCRINVNENMPLAKELKIMGLPTIVLYNGGQIIYRETGYQNNLYFDNLFRELAIVS